ETLQERTSSDFDLTLVPVIKHRDLDFLNHGIENLWSVLNNFSKKSVDTDWDILDSHADKFDKDDESRNIYNALFDFYEKLSGKIGSDRKIAYLRLGFGKTYFDNSLGLAIYDESPDIFMKYVKLLSLGKPRQKEFPVTRTVCTNPLIPMGWTTLQF
ncbi:MAG TPA: hypothetical protein PL003_10465, partial [Bacteroidales bacterium]|nr:hypothetical protein [Bacteroidales bacterium]